MKHTNEEREQICKGERCPKCDMVDASRIEDNGGSIRMVQDPDGEGFVAEGDLTYLHTTCGTQWDAIDYRDGRQSFHKES